MLSIIRYYLIYKIEHNSFIFILLRLSNKTKQVFTVDTSKMN